ncbi:MAG: hypothetical protein GY719_24080 [bacterium]|nr:hypothetical protein [bacterium]
MSTVRKLTTHLVLACLLPMVAGEAWAEELLGAARLRVARGEPSILAQAASHLPTVEDVRSRASSARAAVGPPLEAVVEGIGASLAISADAEAAPERETGSDPAGIQLASARPIGAAAKDATESQDPPAVPPVPRLPPAARALGTGTPWHLLSVPGEPDDVDPATLLPAVAGDFSLAYTYDACDTIAPWRVYDPADLPASDLTAVDHRGGFWLRGTDPDPLAVSGTEPAETQVQLCEGWNLIGYPLAQDRPVLAALSSIAGKLLRVYGFDPSTPKNLWRVYDVGVPDWANTLRTMERGRGYWIWATEDTTLVMRNVGPPPEVEITSPEDGATVTFLTDVVGSVRSDLLGRWELAHRLRGESIWTTFATGDTPVIDDLLGVLDTTLLLNGLYQIRLEATDFSGRSTSVAIDVVVEGRAKIGHFTLTFIDFDVPVAGLPIQVIRTYDSRDKRTGDFGVGWRLTLSDIRLQENRAPGEDWQGTRTGIVIPTYCVRPTESHIITITLTDDAVLRFRPTPSPECQFAVPQQAVDLGYEPLPGTLGSLRPLDQSEQALVVGSFPGPVELWDLQTVQPHDPALYELTLRDGRVAVIHEEDGLRSLTDLNGNQLIVSDAGIVHSSGRGISFDRDTESRIVTATDPGGNSITYAYDDRGDLISVTGPLGNTTRFIYDSNHLLLEIEDPRGIRPIRNDYDENGRLIRNTDAFGNVIELGHDFEGRREVVTNRLGFTRVLEYDERGNVVREIDELGHTTHRTFDDRDNPLTETDPLGRTTTQTYSAEDDRLSLTDPLGNTTNFSYNDRGQLSSLTDPRGGVTSNVYDVRGNLIRTTNAAGQATSMAYDAAGNLISATDALGQVTTFEYDSFGNRTREVDPLGHEKISTYDSRGFQLTETRTRTLADGSTETLVTSFGTNDLGWLTSTTAADGSTQSATYDLLGRITRQVDQLGRETTAEYDLMGRLTTFGLPDGTTRSQTYDAEGRLIAQVDRGGRATTFSYDAVGRLLETTLPTDATITNTYDAAGQLGAQTDSRGNTHTARYDDAGRRISVTDPLGNSRTYTHDANGNETSITDAKGNRTVFSFDELDRLTLATFPDGTTSRVDFDALGRRRSETDAAGLVTSYGYDDLGRLASVTDALDQVTRFTYDEMGNRISQIDANGNATRFEYDRLSRLTRRILPDGSAESMTYYADGTLASHVDFNGASRTFEYDAGQRLIRRASADGSEVVFTYTPAGQRASVTDDRGTTSYTYDLADRLIERIDPTGHRLGYSYDSEGNLTTLTATVGLSALATTYTYDALNRLATITDPLGAMTTLDYDLNSNRESIGFANGVTTTAGYDGLDRLTALRSESSAGDILQSYAFTLGPVGNRLRVDEHDRTSRHYSYDGLYRLVEDRVTDSTGDPVYRQDFSYDPVGNRLLRSTTDESGTTDVASTFDDRDRLLTAGAVTYGWDTNGNLTTRTGTGVATYGWDLDNRLTHVTLEDGTEIAITYDVDGNRVSSAVTPPGGATIGVDYLVDTSGFLSHVVAEVVNGEIETLYTRAGHELISLYRPASGTQRFFHADGRGSIRMLTDPSAAVTDRYAYTAFGEMLEHSGSDPNPYGFTGEPLEASLGFAYHRARWMWPSRGAFLSMDTFAGLGTAPATLHRYSYGANNPVTYIDPTGLAITKGQLLIGLAALGLIMNSYLLSQNIRAYVRADTDAERWRAASDAGLNIVGIFLAFTGIGPASASPGFATASGPILSEGVVLTFSPVRIIGSVLIPVHQASVGVALNQKTTSGSGDGKEHHELEWQLRDESGRIETRGKVKSGGTKPGRRLNWAEQLLTHTERKVLEILRNRVRPGQTISMQGRLPPCAPGRGIGVGCQRAMQQFAMEKQVQIIYRQIGSSTRWIFKPDGLVQVIK